MAETPLQRYSVASLNRAIGSLLERGFAPRFLLDATVSRPQLKKGHLWMTLVDETASISAVVWASQLAKLSFQPDEGDGVVVVGTLNFWAARANLCVQVFDLRPSLSSVLRRFERVRDRLAPMGLFESERKRPLPETPDCIALLTSVPSSALADMLRTAAERWPATRLVVVPIPVQGNVEGQITATLEHLGSHRERLGIEAVVLARGGGSREDLAVFDGEALALAIAAFPLPVVSGIGHEDDTTIADLVADHRAATPTAALVALLPDRRQARPALQQLRRHLGQLLRLRLQGEHQQLGRLQERLGQLHPRGLLERRREDLERTRRLLLALSPQHVLERGFSLVHTATGRLIRSASELHPGDRLELTLADGRVDGQVVSVHQREAHRHQALRQSRGRRADPSGA